jgi:NTP pyrophosphatase (non-canonical NTP hydrolase)
MKEKQYEELQKLVIKWAEDRNIFEYSNPIKQLTKTQEELDETTNALVKFVDAPNQIEKNKALLEVIDGIGDMLVTIILLSKMVNVDTVDALGTAYNVIKDRKGKMINGLFVKES